MNILNVILGILCLLLTFVIAARSKGLHDRLLWGAVTVAVIGGVALPRLLPGAGFGLLVVILSLAALLFLFQRQRKG
ncbi:hypothetical protein ACWGN9_09705 [Streptomyces sp. NPDC055775]